MSLRCCSHCGSADVVAGLTLLQCYECGLLTDTQGRKVPPGPTFGDGPASGRAGAGQGG